MTQWEYIELSTGPESSTIQGHGREDVFKLSELGPTHKDQALGALGAEGFELVTIVREQIWVFKRPVEGPESEQESPGIGARLRGIFKRT